MRIVVLEGSPNKNGSSNMLANKFIEGAEKSGHSVKVISAPTHKHLSMYRLHTLWIRRSLRIEWWYAMG